MEITALCGGALGRARSTTPIFQGVRTMGPYKKHWFTLIGLCIVMFSLLGYLYTT